MEIDELVTGLLAIVAIAFVVLLALVKFLLVLGILAAVLLILLKFGLGIEVI